jgi:formamidopyrimidine-DNA glycosylase
MPELPEVETVRRGLTPLIGATISNAELYHRRTFRQFPGTAEEFASQLVGSQVSAIARRGKFLWMPFAERSALVVHLGMTGQLRLDTGIAGANPHLRARINLTTPDGDGINLDFIDPRTFGYLALSSLTPTDDGAPAGEGSITALLPDIASHIARDIADPHLDLTAASGRIATTSRPIKTALLDQNLISGIGNIYVDEALWECGIDPRTKASALSPSTILQILAAARAVSERSLAAGGTTFDGQYVDAQGNAGNFVNELNAYGRAGKPCYRCGSAIEKFPLGGRGTHVCPTCQAGVGH